MATRDRSTWPGWARALTTGWVLSPLIVIALLLASFEGYGYYTRHQKTTYARGGAFGGGSVSVAAGGHALKNGGHGARSKSGKGAHHGVKNGGTHVSTLGTAHGGGHSTSSPGTSDPGGSSSSPGSRHHGSTSGTGSSSPAPRSSASDQVVTPPTGTYTLAVSGSENAKFGPISACHNSYPSRATLAVHHASGESPTSYDFDMRLYPGSPNKHDERHIYKYSPNAVTLSYEQETVTCSGIKQSTTVDYSPAQTRVELPLSVGASWHNHGGGSARSETGTSNVVKKTTLSVQGHSYTVYEIVTKLQMSGSETGERDQTWWYAPDLGMPLKFSESLHGKRSGASYSEDFTASVIKLP